MRYLAVFHGGALHGHQHEVDVPERDPHYYWQRDAAKDRETLELTSGYRLACIDNGNRVVEYVAQ